MGNNTKRVVVASNNSFCVEAQEKSVGISLSKVYAQIAKYSNNPSRSNEVQILRKAIKSASGEKHLDSRYAIMKFVDAELCFGEELRRFPKSMLFSIEAK